MSRLWKLIKDHPYVSTAVVFGSVGAYIYWDQQKKQAEMEERIRRNRQDSENRDRARREAAAVTAASNAFGIKKNDTTSTSENSIVCPPMPRTPSLSRTEFEQWTAKIAPGFKGEAYYESAFEEFDLAAHQGRWVILLFIPLELVHAGVSVPNSAGIELLVEIQEKLHSFVTKHCDIIVVSPESKHYLKKLAESPHSEGGLGGVDFPLVSDLNMVAASLYGVPPASDSESSQSLLYILAPQMVIQERECYHSSKLPTANHLLKRLSQLQATD